MLNSIKSAFTNRPDKGQCRDAGLALVLILLLSMAFSGAPRLLPLAIAALVADMIWPRFYHPFAILWFGLAHLLGEFVSRVLLAIVFLFLVTPVGLVRRLLGKDTLQLRGFKRDSISVMQLRCHTYAKQDLEHPY